MLFLFILGQLMVRLIDWHFSSYLHQFFVKDTAYKVIGGTLAWWILSTRVPQDSAPICSGHLQLVCVYRRHFPLFSSIFQSCSVHPQSSNCASKPFQCNYACIDLFWWLLNYCIHVVLMLCNDFMGVTYVISLYTLTIDRSAIYFELFLDFALLLCHTSCKVRTDTLAWLLVCMR